MNWIDLQQLALVRVREAKALLNASEWSGAYYLTGYAVECGLKACIAKRTNLHDFPDKDRVQKSYSHKVEVLVDLAGFASQRDADAATISALYFNWSLVRKWDETARYSQWTEFQARSLFLAVANPTEGVLPWIMGHW